MSTSVVGEGTTTPSAGTYEEGEVVTITGTPSEHWIFNNWSGDGSGNNTTLSITMDSDKNVVGNFSEKLYPLNILVEGEGSVTEDVIQNKSEHAVGTVVQLTSKPVDGWVFYEWIGDIDGNDNPKTIEINKGIEVTSVFKSIDELLTTEISGEGTVTIQQESFEDNPSRRKVTLSPIPSQDYEFVEWSGDISSTDDIVSVTMDGVLNVTATFRHVLDGRNLQKVNGYIHEETNYPSPETNVYSSTWDYDTNENLTNFVSYDSDDTILYSDVYTYDVNHNRIEEIRTGPDDSVTYRITFTYNSDNYLTEQIYYDSDGSISVRFAYTYDSNNNLIERILYNSSNSVSLRIAYTYDSNINLTEIIYYRSDDSVLGRDRYTYDSNNNLAKQIYYGADDSVLGIDTYTYDSHNNLIQWDYNSDTSNWTTEYEYDFNGFLTNIYDVYNFLRSDIWYKTITTENRENIYYERGLNKSNQKSTTLNSKNHQLIWNFDRLNRKSNISRYRDLIGRFDIDFLPNPYPHHPNRIF